MYSRLKESVLMTCPINNLLKSKWDIILVLPYNFIYLQCAELKNAVVIYSILKYTSTSKHILPLNFEPRCIEYSVTCNASCLFKRFQSSPDCVPLKKIVENLPTELTRRFYSWPISTSVSWPWTKTLFILNLIYLYLT